VDSDENRDSSRRPAVKDRRWSNTGRILDDCTIERSGDTMCGMHRAEGDDERRFIGLASKLTSTISPSLDSKSVTSVSRFEHQNR
jgi:hypothetical protein